MSTYAFESAERIICCFFEDGKWNLAKLDTRTKRFDPIPARFTDISQLRAGPGPPFSQKFTAPQAQKAPILVKSHGGPTASISRTLSLAVQFWTSRGIGVLDVNYRGSTGYGRSYRLRLKQQWGISDVQDCIYGARYLIGNRNADPDRLMISGGSAGGSAVRPDPRA